MKTFIHSFTILSNEEASASELLENNEKMFLRYRMDIGQ